MASLELRPGDRVLEVGCGTGAITKRLLAAGAHVTALDRSGDMLDAARRRAPGADYRNCDVTSADLGEGYDCVVLAFVLHELPSEKRKSPVSAAARHVASPGGRVAVMEWALPANATGRRSLAPHHPHHRAATRARARRRLGDRRARGRGASTSPRRAAPPKAGSRWSLRRPDRSLARLLLLGSAG